MSEDEICPNEQGDEISQDDKEEEDKASQNKKEDGVRGRVTKVCTFGGDASRN
jgi:hypothetical protein